MFPLPTSPPAHSSSPSPNEPGASEARSTSDRPVGLRFARRTSWLRRAPEILIETVIRLCGWSAIFFVFAIFFFVFREGAPFLFRDLDLKEFFTSSNWNPVSTQPHYGILGLLCGTVSVTLLSMVIAVPLGLGAAVYVSEFSTPKIKEFLKITIEMLAAIPSIVWGFIAYVILNPLIIAATGAPVGVNILNAGIILALMSVPVIVSVGEDALKAVPDAYREAALALGASRWEIVYRVLFPAAKNGLLAAVLLGVGRAIGETMAVLMATGHANQIPTSVLDRVQTLTATIAAELGETVHGDDHYRVLFVIGMLLFAIAFVVNLTADLVVKGIRGKQNA
jgi:phosphate transport system permease protein